MNADGVSGPTLQGRTVAPASPVDTTIFPSREEQNRRKKRERIRRINARLKASCAFCDWTASGDAHPVLRAQLAHRHEHGVEPLRLLGGRGRGRAPSSQLKAWRAFQDAPGVWMTTTEIVDASGLNRSQALNACHALARRGLITSKGRRQTRRWIFTNGASPSAPEEAGASSNVRALASQPSTTEETT